MRGTGHNEGIQMSGGRIEAGALAVGRGAHAHNVVRTARRELEDRGHAELGQRLEELLLQLDAHASRLSDAEELRESTQLVAEELVKDRPNKTTVTGVLAGIAENVKSVASLATAAEALTQAVQLFL
jgi:translation initiation factor 2B subunit (eIF-2B alpha/beta/delta family)